MSSPVLPKRRLATLPLMRRESIGGLYHVLTFEDAEGTLALPGQFTMVRGAEWGDVVVPPRSVENALLALLGRTEVVDDIRLPRTAVLHVGGK